MNNLNQIPKTGTFGQAVDAMNTDFGLVQTAITQLEVSAFKDVGYFSSASALQSAYPSPTKGMKADVYDSTAEAYVVYVCNTNGTWTNTGNTDARQLVVDNYPTDNSTNLVQSGGVKQALNKIGFYDISADHSNTSYASLSQALNAVPTACQKGGMTVKYIDSTSGLYVQYMLLSASWNKTEGNWKEIDLDTNNTKFNCDGYGAAPVEMSAGYIVCNGAAGTVVDLTPVSHTTYTHAIVNCTPGTILYVQGKGGNSDRLYCFIDSENKVISSAVANLNQETPLKLYAPSNTAKVIINDENTKRDSYIGEKLGILAEMAADGYSFLGVATLITVPVTASQAKGKVFYLVSEPGTYERFGNLVVNPGRLYVFRKDFSAQAPNWYITEVWDIRKYTSGLNVNVLNNKSDAYDNATLARNAVPNALRQKGLIYTYLLSDGWHTEQFVGTDTVNWTSADNAGAIYRKDVTYDDYYMVVPFTTDIPTSRENVPYNKRKNGMIIAVKDNQGVWHIEQNRGIDSI